MVYLFADQMVIVLFKRGSFDASSVKMSSDLLRWLALSLPFTAVVSIAGNLYVAAQRIRVSIGYQIASNLLLIGLVFFSLKWFGYIGYPIAFLGVNALNVLVVYIFCRLYFQFIRYGTVLKYLLLMIVANSLIVVGLKMLFLLIPHKSAWLDLIIGGAVYLSLLMAMNAAFNLNTDFSNYVSGFRRKLVTRKI